MLLGYGTNQNGYRLYDFKCMKVIHSRDVVLDEASMPGILKEKETAVKYVELEIEVEPIEETAITNPPNSESKRYLCMNKSQRHPIRLNQVYADQTNNSPTGTATTLQWCQLNSKTPPQ